MVVFYFGGTACGVFWAYAGAALCREKAAKRPQQFALAAPLAQGLDHMCLGVLACYFDRGKTAGFCIATNLASCHFFPRHGVRPFLRGPALLPSRASGGQRARLLWNADTKMPQGAPVSTPCGIRPYWQASQSGSSIAQAFGTGAGPAAWTGALSPPLETALSLPVLMVDFSVLVAARARR